jgi:hypothetical protein
VVLVVLPADDLHSKGAVLAAGCELRLLVCLQAIYDLLLYRNQARLLRSCALCATSVQTAVDGDFLGIGSSCT